MCEAINADATLNIEGEMVHCTSLKLHFTYDAHYELLTDALQRQELAFFNVMNKAKLILLRLETSSKCSQITVYCPLRASFSVML